MAALVAALARSVWLYKLAISLWLLLVKAPWWALAGAARVAAGSYAIAITHVRELWKGAE